MVQNALVLLSERQVAQLLSLSVQTLRNNRCNRKGLPYVKLGRSIRYRAADVEEHISSRLIEPEEN